jgi:hypothetical protein
MSKTWTTPVTQGDQKLLDELFAQVAPTITDVVTTLMRQGRPLILIGAFFERAFDGKVSGGCSHRAELARRALTDPRFSDAVRAGILGTLKDAGAEELPIVLVIDRGEGLVAVGVRRERGKLVGGS